MYAQYHYLPTATQAQVLADIALILTGTTTVTSLSASCDMPNTSIVSIVPAGWTSVDAAAATNARALSAPLVDSATPAKILVIDLNTANFLLTKVYESWNATTHVGTNLAYTSDLTTNAPALTLTAGGWIYISASARHCLIATMDNTLTTFSPGAGIVEHTRNDPWNTVANAYPCSAYLSMKNFGGTTSAASATTHAVYSPRIYQPSIGSDALGSAAGLGVYGPLLCTNTVSNTGGLQGSGLCPTSYGATSAKQTSHILAPIGLSRNNVIVLLGGDISANTGLYSTTLGYGAATDEITVGTDTYVVWSGGVLTTGVVASTRFAIKKA